MLGQSLPMCKLLVANSADKLGFLRVGVGSGTGPFMGRTVNVPGCCASGTRPLSEKLGQE